VLGTPRCKNTRFYTIMKMGLTRSMPSTSPPGDSPPKLINKLRHVLEVGAGLSVRSTGCPLSSPCLTWCCCCCCCCCSSSLLPGKWRFVEQAGKPYQPCQNVTGNQFGDSLVGNFLRVYWDPYVAWHDGTVGQCDISKRGVGSCTVSFLSMGVHKYNFSDPAVSWKGKFKPDPARWTLPADPSFHRARNFMEGTAWLDGLVWLVASRCTQCVNPTCFPAVESNQ
jgi:hypothetical protein